MVNVSNVILSPQALWRGITPDAQKKLCGLTEACSNNSSHNRLYSRCISLSCVSAGLNGVYEAVLTPYFRDSTKLKKELNEFNDAVRTWSTRNLTDFRRQAQYYSFQPVNPAKFLPSGQVDYLPRLLLIDASERVSFGSILLKSPKKWRNVFLQKTKIF